MIQFDFFSGTKEEWFNSFCEYFGLDHQKTLYYFETVDCDQLTPARLTQDLDLNLSDYDSGDVSIICRQMTTSTPKDTDNFTTCGILDLKCMLQENTPLSEFLDRYGIKVNVDTKIFTFNGKDYPITSTNESCDFCFKGKDGPCNNYFKCDPRKKMNRLGSKLYQYGATVEFFTHATIEQMKRYSSIRWCPEVLQTLDAIVSSLNGFSTTAYEMSYAWRKGKNKCYFLEFSALLNTMETFTPMDFNGAWDEIKDCLIQSGYNHNDYYSHLIPQNVLDNMIFIRWFISIYFHGSEELGSLLPGLCVKPEAVKVVEVY